MRLLVAPLVATFFAQHACAEGALRPVTAFCFKVLGDNRLCTCATERLEHELEPMAMPRYENLIRHALAQTNVPRKQAWEVALDRQARDEGGRLEAVRLDTGTSGRAHSSSVKACQRPTSAD